MTSVDVAREAGVSQATVARAYSNPDVVSERTLARVKDAAAALGYVPNAIARSLKSNRTGIVGAVVPAGSEYWQHVVSAFSEKLTASARQLLLFSFHDPDRLVDVLDAVDQYRLDGLILASSQVTAAQIARVGASPLPVVAFNQPAADGLVASVSVDNEGGGRAVAEHLASLDIATAAFVGGVSTASTDRLRYQGVVRALGAAGIGCPYVEAGAFSYEAGFKAAAALAETPLPEALVVAGDELAFGVIDGLGAAGFDVPADVLVTGFDGLPQSAWAGYDLTTLVQPTDALVERTLELLGDGPTADPVRGATSVVVAGELRAGRSTRRTHG